MLSPSDIENQIDPDLINYTIGMRGYNVLTVFLFAVDLCFWLKNNDDDLFQLNARILYLVLVSLYTMSTIMGMCYAPRECNTLVISRIHNVNVLYILLINALMYEPTVIKLYILFIHSLALVITSCIECLWPFDEFARLLKLHINITLISATITLMLISIQLFTYKANDIYLILAIPNLLLMLFTGYIYLYTVLAHTLSVAALFTFVCIDSTL
jgi:hypothetical protein